MPETAWPKNLPRHLSYPDVAVDAILVGAAHAYPDRAALVEGDNSLTFRQLLDQARRVAAGLRARGIEPGDVIALHMPNSLWFMVAYYGAVLSGAAVAPINPAQPVAALRNQLDDVAAKAVFTSPTSARQALDAAAPSVGLLVGVPGPGNLPAGITPLADLLENEPLTGYRVDPNLVAHLQLTGGTTGRSKAVRVLHRNLIANLIQCVVWRASAVSHVDADGGLRFEQLPDAVGPHTLTPGHGVYLGIAPFFHGLGLVGQNIEVALGTTVVLAGRFRPEQLIGDIERYGVTHVVGSPPMYYAMLRSPALDQHDVSSVRMIVSGAAPIDTSALGALAEHFPNAGVIEGYGCSEATMGVTCALVWCDKPNPVGSIGIPLFDTEVELRDKDGRAVPEGEVGELCLRGPQVTDGYHNEPELTSHQFRDGWLLTGDLARRDEGGFLYIVGREKDMVIYKGYNVHPQPLEEILCSHPDIAQAAVVGRKDTDAGEIPVGFVVLAPDAQSHPGLADQVMAYVAERVAPYQKVRELHVIDSLPVTPTGKVLKSDLRALVAG